MPGDYIELVGAREVRKEDTPWQYILLLGVVALTSGIANGYNGTVLEGAIPRLQYQGQILDPFDMGLLEGALSLGGLLGSLVCSELATAMSRRLLVVFGEATIVTGVLCFATVGSVGTFPQALLGRTLTGVGVGVCGLAKPLIVSELAPPRRRGLLVAFFAVGQSLGLNAFYLTDWALPPPEVGWAWRVLVVLGATPAFAVICLAFVFRESEDDYWDVPQRQKMAEAEGGAASQLHRMLTREPPQVSSARPPPISHDLRRSSRARRRRCGATSASSSRLWSGTTSRARSSSPTTPPTSSPTRRASCRWSSASCSSRACSREPRSPTRCDLALSPLEARERPLRAPVWRRVTPAPIRHGLPRSPVISLRPGGPPPAAARLVRAHRARPLRDGCAARHAQRARRRRRRRKRGAARDMGADAADDDGRVRGGRGSWLTKAVHPVERHRVVCLPGPSEASGRAKVEDPPPFKHQERASTRCESCSRPN